MKKKKVKYVEPKPKPTRPSKVPKKMVAKNRNAPSRGAMKIC